MIMRDSSDEDDSSRRDDSISTTRRDPDAYEATELARIRTLYRQYSQASEARRQAAQPTPQRPQGFPARVIYDISNFWRHEISVTVDHKWCRDHLALERTFLGYLRTSLAISMLGILVAQLFRLQHSPTANPIFGYYVIGKPLACICQALALLTLLLGAFRAWRLQHAIVRGKTLTGGFELVLIGLGVLLLSVLFFVLLIAADISKED